MGEQEGASYNGHFGIMCYHPLFVFNQFGDCEGAKLRAGNVHSAHEWEAGAGKDPFAVRGEGSAGSYRPVIAGAKLREGYNHDFAKRGRALFGCLLSYSVGDQLPNIGGMSCKAIQESMH